MSSVHRFVTSAASSRLLSDIHELMVSAFTEGFSVEDWEHTLGGQSIVVMDGDTLLAHASIVPRTLHVNEQPFNVGYLEGVATQRALEGKGHGSTAVSDAMSVVRERFEMGALSTSRHTFYERLGWERWCGPTSVRQGSDLIRTEDEDSGILVLRFGVSHAVELSAPLSCDARSGDDW